MAAKKQARRLGEAHNSLHSLVYKELRASIVSGRFKPGERLIEERLAEEYGVSRNPVREAIRALASEGLVNVSSRRGAQVADVEADAAQEVIEIRALLEAHNARLAARHRNPGMIRNAAAILEKGQEAAASGTVQNLRQLNEQFHQALAEAGSNRLLSEMLETLRAKSALLFAPYDPAQQKVRWEEHAAILQAIVDGDEEQAASQALSHVLRAGEGDVAKKT